MLRSALDMQGNIATSGTPLCECKTTRSAEPNSQISGTALDRMALSIGLSARNNATPL
jgi:hypothetical protein